ncbi:DNA cytosine methyltransferase [Frigoribacterium sp. CFBP 13729]|nr:DNA cytosine methyltransferase [Frigoribacterium sp. CFBP 13729]
MDDFVAWSRAESATRPLAVDLFSGAGGLGLGVEAAGWTVVAAVDHDERAIKTHEANFRGRSETMDLADPNSLDKLRAMLEDVPVDIVVGGPPCQPFSRAGKAKIRSLVADGIRDAVDTRRELWRTFVDAVVMLRPRAVLLENVPDMALGDDLSVVRVLADMLEEAGYDVDYRLLDAWRYGVPQHRKRFILQGRSDGHPISWPHDAGSRTTVRDAIADLPDLGDSSGQPSMKYLPRPVNEFVSALRELADPDVVHDHVTRPVREDDREAFSLMTSKTLYSELPARLRRYRSDTFDDKYKRLGWDELSRTITAHIAKDGYWYIHPEEPRSLSVREAARLQTFPDTFRFAGTRSDAFRQIGNAVPPMLGRAVAQQLVHDAEADAGGLKIRQIRAALDTWAAADKIQRWWLYPVRDGPPSLSPLLALLRLHTVPESRAQGAAMVSREWAAASNVELTDGTANIFSPAQIRRLHPLMNLHASSDLAAVVQGLLTPLERRAAQLLAGIPELLQSARVGAVVAEILSLPPEQHGLHSGLKVGLAQLVGIGDGGAERMCALRVMTLQDANDVRRMT